MRDYADNRMEGEGRRRARRNSHVVALVRVKVRDVLGLDGETGESYIPLSHYTRQSCSECVRPRLHLRSGVGGTGGVSRRRL